jgi:putative DNA primase/helicase
MTHLAGVDYDPAAACPLWIQTLSEIFAGKDKNQLIDYLQRAIGYTLTGLTKEEIFHLLWGDGRNGKGTIVETLRLILGSYARPATMALFLAQRNDTSKQFEVADLAGVRMVIASEAAAGKAFDTAILKSWTGGDERKGCHKHKPFFTYKPCDKLWFQVNDKPTVASWDIAFNERCRLLPFLNSFTREIGNLDRNRKEDLKRELPGILAWCVRGTMRYLTEGLEPPDVVVAAVDEYRQENTRVAEFLEQNFQTVAGMTFEQAEVYRRYRSWCQGQGLEPVAENRFGRHLKDAGYETKRTGGRRIVEGIAIRQHDDNDNDDGRAGNG